MSMIENSAPGAWAAVLAYYANEDATKVNPLVRDEPWSSFLFPRGPVVVCHYLRESWPKDEVRFPSAHPPTP